MPVKAASSEYRTIQTEGNLRRDLTEGGDGTLADTGGEDDAGAAAAAGDGGAGRPAPPPPDLELRVGPLHLCALGRESVIVCNFAISTARGIVPLSGTVEMAPIRSYGATNDTWERGAQTPIILASGIPHGMHGQHI